MNLGSRTESKFSHFDEENGISSPKLVLFFLHFFPIMYLRARFRFPKQSEWGILIQKVGHKWDSHFYIWVEYMVCVLSMTTV